MRLYRLYIGSNNETGKLEQAKIQEIASRHFDGWTLYNALGAWKGQLEHSAILEIATEHSDEIVSLANELKEKLSQQSIMFELGGDVDFF